MSPRRHCTCGNARPGPWTKGQCVLCWHELYGPNTVSTPTPAEPAPPPPAACRFGGGPVTVTLIHPCTKRPYPAQRLRCEHPERAAAHPTPHKAFCRHKCPDFERPSP